MTKSTKSPADQYRIQIRKYPGRAGLTWRWWVFDRKRGTQIDTGTVLNASREHVEEAAEAAIDRIIRTEAKGPAIERVPAAEHH